MPETGVILVVLGGGLLIAGSAVAAQPPLWHRLNRIAGRIVFTDSWFFAAPRVSGAGFIALGLLVVLAIMRYEAEMVVLFGGVWALVVIFRLAGYAAMVIGMLFLVRPLLLVRLAALTEVVIFHEHTVTTSPRLIGIIMAVGGGLALYFGLVLWE